MFDKKFELPGLLIWKFKPLLPNLNVEGYWFSMPVSKDKHQPRVEPALDHSPTNSKPASLKFLSAILEGKINGLYDAILVLFYTL